MKFLRPFLWAMVLVAGFLYLTSAAHWDVGRLLQPVRSVGRLWSEPTPPKRPDFRPTSRTISGSIRMPATPR